MPNPLPTDEATLQTAKERLYDRSVLSDDESCWLWLGHVDSSGYGEMSINGTTHKAHRISYHIHIGQIPQGLFVLHQCDVRPCINPYHLFVGTHADNVADRVKKGRSGRLMGETNHSSKITAEDVRAIKSLLSEGRSHTYIATLYPISRRSIGYIASGQTWQHVKEHMP